MAPNQPVYLGLGSNLSNPIQHIEHAIYQLTHTPNIQVIKTAKFFLNPAIANHPQPDFVNTVVYARTSLSPFQLLNTTQTIEQSFGQPIDKHGAARIIDIDLLCYHQQIIHHSTLTLPHPRLHERRFVLHPFSELNPQWIHPVLKQSIQSLSQSLTPQLSLTP